MKKSIIFFAVALLGLASCSDSFLDRQYEGGMLSQEKYDQLSSEKLENTLLGCYTMIYTMNSEEHDEFGQRSIDLWGDILSGDIAVTNKTYGWLYPDEQMSTVTERTGTIWVFYYDMIHNINVVINSIESSSQISSIIAQHGYPSDTTNYEYTAEQTNYALYLAQAKALRGYCYANLARWYTPIFTVAGYTIDNYKCVPVYTEDNMTQAQGLSTSAKVYERAFDDLGTAINLFEKFGALYEEQNDAVYTRTSKLAIDVNVARGLLAYAYLNAAPYYTNVNDAKAKNYYRKAHQYAHDAIESNEYRIIPNNMLYSTGFNDVSEASWMWGQNVVTETAGQLKSWFGQMDIHSYSYAWAGDTKVIDENLKNLIPAWDGRSRWFNDGSKQSAFKDCPDGKFYSAVSPNSTKAEDIDREWLSDNVFMRIESMYLIAAEACYFIDSLDASKNYLTAITDQRLNDEYPLAASDYETYKSTLTGEKLIKEIELNWRVEMWGEGYGLQTFRRLTGTKKRGGNHDVGAGAEVKASDASFNMNIPSSEATYNPEI